MRRLLAVTAALFSTTLAYVGVSLAHADELRFASVCNVSSTLVKCCSNALDAGGTGPGRKLAFQVRDAGAVYYRASCAPRADGGVTCVLDAGVNDPYVDFSSNTDPYKVDMPAGADRICFMGNSTANLCVDCYERRP